MPVSGLIVVTGYFSETVCAWTKYIRQRCGDFVETQDTIIGGKCIIVQVDETKLGKRKYHKVHRVDGIWVVVGIERTPEKKFYSRGRKKGCSDHVSNNLRAYSSRINSLYRQMKGLKTTSYRFRIISWTVNHSVTFKDPKTGLHTNTVGVSTMGSNIKSKLGTEQEKK